MRKKLKSSEKIGFFHSVMSKNWTHDLPIFKGAFEGGNQGCKRAKRTFSSRSYVEKCEIFWDIWSWKLGENTFLGARGKGGVGGGRHLFRGHHSESQQNFSFSGLMSKNVIVSEIINSQKSTETVKHRNFRISIKNFLLDFFWTQRSQNPKKTKKWVFQNLTHFLPRQANALGKCPFALK